MDEPLTKTETANERTPTTLAIETTPASNNCSETVALTATHTRIQTQHTTHASSTSIRSRGSHKGNKALRIARCSPTLRCAAAHAAKQFESCEAHVTRRVTKSLKGAFFLAFKNAAARSSSTIVTSRHSFPTTVPLSQQMNRSQDKL